MTTITVTKDIEIEVELEDFSDHQLEQELRDRGFGVLPSMNLKARDPVPMAIEILKKEGFPESIIAYLSEWGTCPWAAPGVSV